MMIRDYHLEFIYIRILFKNKLKVRYKRMRIIFMRRKNKIIIKIPSIIFKQLYYTRTKNISVIASWNKKRPMKIVKYMYKFFINLDILYTVSVAF